MRGIWHPRVAAACFLLGLGLVFLINLGIARIIASAGLRIRNTEVISGADTGIEHEMEWNLGGEVRVLEEDVPMAVVAELALALSP